MPDFVRVLLSIYAACQVLRHLGWWRTANLPARQGGSLGNPFNDPEHFCCVYDAKPCPIDMVCVTEPNGESLVPRVAYTGLLAWMGHFIALYVLLVVQDSSMVTAVGVLAAYLVLEFKLLRI